MNRPKCGVCGRDALPRRGVCSRCNLGTDRPRGDCTDCHKPDQLLDFAFRCRTCRARAIKRCGECHQSALKLTGYNGARICDRCKLGHYLDVVIPADPPGALAALRSAILKAEPLATMRWLRRAGELLTALDNGTIDLTHSTLDDLPRRLSVEYLRALLIETAILPADEGGGIRRLQSDIDRRTRVLTEQHRRVITRWMRWKVLPGLRRRADDGHDLVVPVRNERRKVLATIEFLAWLQERERALDGATQHDIDDWFGGTGAIRWTVRTFMAWAQREREMPRRLVLPPAHIGTRNPPVDAEERWRLAKELMDNDSLDPVDRVAGALVVLYAQPMTRIVKLTMSDVVIEGDNVLLRLGPDPLELPEPLASLIQKLPHSRRCSTAQQLPNPWLFPGGHAGKHILATSLGIRLRSIGIQSVRMRVAATEQLSREVAPTVLTGVLGLSAAHAVRAAAKAAGDWTDYAATRST